MNLIEGSFVALLAETVIVSLSGVMAPGPLSAVALGHGSRAGSAGAWIAMGHGVVEFPLMLGLFLGLGCLQEFGTVSSLVGLSGGMVLLVLGVGMLRGAKSPVAGWTGNRSALGLGILLTAFNPFLWVWWLSVGAALILKFTTYDPKGLIIFALVHWLCDLGWLLFLSLLGRRGGIFFGRRFQRVLFRLSGLSLIAVGSHFLWEALVRNCSTG